MTETTPPNSQLRLRVDVRKGTLALHHNGEQLTSLPLNVQTIHALYDAIDGQLIADGLLLDIPEKDILTPLGFEAMLQTTMMNMVSCIFPKINTTAPTGNRLPSLNPYAEINSIRNAAFINDLNHVHILRNSLAGKPVLVALPGPSLDVDYIRKYRKSFVLLAAGRGAGKLLDEGIHPDYIYIQDVNTKAWDLNFGRLGNAKIPSVLIANPMGRIWKYHRNFKRVFKAWNLYTFERDGFPKLEEIAPSSVSGAYSLARLLGCNPIVFMGNDSGANTPPPAESTLPEAVTNIEYAREGDRLVFKPVSNKRDLRLRFGDELSITTQFDYIAGLQWLKIRTTRDIHESGITVYDHSLTKICQFHSLIKDGSEYSPQGKISLPELPRYETNYDAVKFIRHKKQSYEFILRQLKSGRIPESALSRPFSSIFFDSPMGATDSTEPTKDDFKIGAKNAVALIEHADTALAEVL